MRYYFWLCLRIFRIFFNTIFDGGAAPHFGLEEASSKLQEDFLFGYLPVF